MLKEKIDVAVSDVFRPLSIPEARRVMKANFWGVEEWEEFLGVKFDHLFIPPICFSRRLLESPYPFLNDRQVKEVSFLFLGLEKLNKEPFNLIRWHQLWPKLGAPAFYDTNESYQNRYFAKTAVCSFRWYLMPIAILIEDLKTWPEQIKVLSNYQNVFAVPSTIEVVTAYILYYWKNGLTEKNYSGQQLWGRTRDMIYSNKRVVVGDKGKGEIRISWRYDNVAYLDTGLLVSWVPFEFKS